MAEIKAQFPEIVPGQTAGLDNDDIRRIAEASREYRLSVGEELEVFSLEAHFGAAMAEIDLGGLKRMSRSYRDEKLPNSNQLGKAIEKTKALYRDESKATAKAARVLLSPYRPRKNK